MTASPRTVKPSPALHPRGARCNPRAARSTILGIVAGQGTIGLEIVRQAASRGVSKLDACARAVQRRAAVVSGIALALSGGRARARRRSASSPSGSTACGCRWRRRERSTAPAGALSMADALMAPTPGKVPFALAKRVDEGRSRGERPGARAAAVAYAATVLKLIIEPGGSAGLAALLAGRYDVHGKSVAVVLTGGQLRFRNRGGVRGANECFMTRAAGYQFGTFAFQIGRNFARDWRK